MSKKILFAFFFVTLCHSIASAQVTIAGWHYEPLSGTTAAPVSNTVAYAWSPSGSSAIVNNGGGTVTAGTATGEDPAGTGCGTQNGTTAWALNPFDPGTVDQGNGVQYKVSTAGFQNIRFTWDQRWSNTAPNTLRVQYTTDGTTWTNFTMTAANTTYCKGNIVNGKFETDADGDKYRRISVDLSAVTAANNNPNFGVRILAAYYQATGQFRQALDPTLAAGSLGTWRFDNVAISGTAMAGPSASVLSAVASPVCAGSQAYIRIVMTGGQGLYNVVYSDGTNSYTVNNYVSGTSIAVASAPGTSLTYTIVSVQNAATHVAGTGNSGSGNTVVVRPVLSISAHDYSACTGAVNLTSAATMGLSYSPAGGTISYSPSITSPTAYTGGTITFSFVYTYGGCSVTSVPVTFTRNTAPVVSTAPSATAEVNCYGFDFPTLSVASANATSYQWYYDSDQNTGNGGLTLISGASASSYTPPGNFTGTRYYICRLFNSCSSTYSAYSGAHTVKSTTWNGTTWSNGVPDSSTSAVFAGNYSSAGNLSACTVQVNSGTVVFNPGHTLSVENGVSVSGGSLTFENNASLLQVNNAVNSGTITYKRDTTPVRRYDYTYWSSPVDAQILANLSPLTLADKYYWWNTAIGNWANITAPGITPMTLGQGYIVRAPQNFDPVTPAIFNGAFQGVPNNGDIPVTITVSGSSDLNLIGNPYPSAIDADALLDPAGPNASILGGTIYLWTHNTPINPLQYTQSDYAVYNATGGVGTAGGGTGNTNVPNGYIAAGQGFFIHGINSGGTAYFRNNMRMAGNNDMFFRPAATQHTGKSRIWLEMTNDQGAYKQILIGYLPGATNGIDRNYDGESVDGGTVGLLYSLAEGKKFAIQGRALPFDGNDIIPLGYKSTISGTFTIALSAFDGLFNDQDIYLEDLQTGAIQNLKENGLVFSTPAGTFDGRFQLRFNPGTALGTGDFSFGQDIIAVKESAQVKIISKTLDIKSVVAFDLAGRKIAQIAGNGREASLNIRETFALVVLRVITSDGNQHVVKILD